MYFLVYITLRLAVEAVILTVRLAVLALRIGIPLLAALAVAMWGVAVATAGLLAGATVAGHDAFRRRRAARAAVAAVPRDAFGNPTL